MEILPELARSRSMLEEGMVEERPEEIERAPL
jgi:hypothetical protein